MRQRTADGAEIANGRVCDHLRGLAHHIVRSREFVAARNDAMGHASADPHRPVGGPGQRGELIDTRDRNQRRSVDQSGIQHRHHGLAAGDASTSFMVR